MIYAFFSAKSVLSKFQSSQKKSFSMSARGLGGIAGFGRLGGDRCTSWLMRTAEYRWTRRCRRTRVERGTIRYRRTRGIGGLAGVGRLEETGGPAGVGGLGGIGGPADVGGLEKKVE